MADGTTVFALQHRMRFLKEEAKKLGIYSAQSCFGNRFLFQSLRAALFLFVKFHFVNFPLATTHLFIESYANFFTAIAREYAQDGVTGKAISSHFDRMRKDPLWDLTNNPVDGIAATPATPTKKAAPRAPRGSGKKVSPKKKKAAQDDEDEDDEESVTNESPSKPNLNRVQTGRVTKARATAKPKSIYIESDAESDGETAIKQEIPSMYSAPASNGHASNGNGFSNGFSTQVGNGYTAPDAMDDDDEGELFSFPPLLFENLNTDSEVLLSLLCGRGLRRRLAVFSLSLTSFSFFSPFQQNFPQSVRVHGFRFPSEFSLRQ